MRAPRIAVLLGGLANELATLGKAGLEGLLHVRADRARRHAFDGKPFERFRELRGRLVPAVGVSLQRLQDDRVEPRRETAVDLRGRLDRAAQDGADGRSVVRTPKQRTPRE